MERLLTRTETDTHIIYTAGHTRFRFDKRDASMLQRVFDLAYAYEGTGLEPEDFKKAFTEETVLKLAAQALGTTPDRLREMVKALDEGRVVVLPCKPSGVTVYQLRSKKHALGVGVSPRHISCATVWADGGYALQHQGADDCLKKDFGKTWFLDCAEAEAALGGGGDG